MTGPSGNRLSICLLPSRPVMICLLIILKYNIENPHPLNYNNSIVHLTKSAYINMEMSTYAGGTCLYMLLLLESI